MYVTWDVDVTSCDNYSVMSKQPPSWIRHLRFQNVSKMSGNCLKLLRNTQNLQTASSGKEKKNGIRHFLEATVVKKTSKHPWL